MEIPALEQAGVWMLKNLLSQLFENGIGVGPGSSGLLE